MKRLLTGLVALTLFAGPASAQTAEEIAAASSLARADVVAQCASTPDGCAALLRAYIAAQPPAVRAALQNDIVAELAASGISVEIDPPAGAPAGGAAAPTTAPTTAPAAPTGAGGSLSEPGDESSPS